MNSIVSEDPTHVDTWTLLRGTQIWSTLYNISRIGPDLGSYNFLSNVETNLPTPKILTLQIQMSLFSTFYE